MRTTVTLDPDVEVLLETEMRESGKTFKQALNDAVREGMRAQRHRVASPRAPYGHPTFRMGKPSAGLPDPGALADHIEDDAIVEKLRQGR